MPNAYLEKLEAEFVLLRNRRVNLRRALERYSKGFRTGDDLDMVRTIDMTRRELSCTEVRWAEICTLLGRQHLLAGPVRLKSAYRR